MKRIVIAIIILILVAGLLGGTFAMFSDTESSENNNFTAGILDIDDAGFLAVDLSQDIVLPGTTYENDIVITMESNSNVTPARFEIDFDADNYSNGTTEWVLSTTCDSLEEYTANVFVNKLTLNGQSLLGASNNYGTAAVPVALSSCTVAMDADWNNDSTPDSVKLSTLLGKLIYIEGYSGNPGTLEFDWGIPGAVTDNALQGDNIDLDIIFAAAQDITQNSIVSD